MVSFLFDNRFICKKYPAFKYLTFDLWHRCTSSSDVAKHPSLFQRLFSDFNFQIKKNIKWGCTTFQLAICSEKKTEYNMKRRKFKTEKPKQVQKCWMIELFLTLHQSIKIPEYTFALPCSFFSLLLFIVAHVGHDSKTVSRLRACCFYLLLSVAQTQFQVDSSPQNQMCESVFINHCSWISCPVLKMFVCLNKRKLQSILLVLKAPRHCVWCGWWVQCGRTRQFSHKLLCLIWRWCVLLRALLGFLKQFDPQFVDRDTAFVVLLLYSHF